MAGMTDKALKTNYAENKYRFGGKELQHQEFSDGTGLEAYDFGARFQDPQLGTWHSVDPMADENRRWSPYNYGMDNPFRFIDQDGMDPIVYGVAWAQDADLSRKSTAVNGEVSNKSGENQEDTRGAPGETKGPSASTLSNDKNSTFAGGTEGGDDSTAPKKPTVPEMKKSPPNTWTPEYKPPKSGARWQKTPKGDGAGWVDKNGDVWVPDDHKEAHAPHWDVQWKSGKDYHTVYPAVQTATVAVVGTAILIGLWEGTKWTIAVLGAAETGGETLA